MAGPLQTTDEVHTVGTLLDPTQHVHDIHFSGAGYPDNVNVGGIIESHGTCQVRG
jgi:hypothetical protein